MQEILLRNAASSAKWPFFSPARSRLIPVYSRKWGASDICLKLKPNKPLSSFFFVGEVRTYRREAKLWQDLNSQVKLQKSVDINIILDLAAPKYMQGGGGTYNPSVSLFFSPPSLSFSLSVMISFSDTCLRTFDRLPLHGKWVINTHKFCSE